MAQLYVIQTNGTLLAVTPSGGTTISDAGLITLGGAGSFTTLDASGNVNLNGTGASVAIQPNNGALNMAVTGTTSITMSTASSGVITITSSAAGAINNMTLGITTPLAAKVTTFTTTGAVTASGAGAASTPAVLVSGVPFAGTGTTSFPLLYINDANATASTTLNTAGTYLGVNGDGTQDLINLLKDGVSLFKVGSTGTITGFTDASNNYTLATASSKTTLTAVRGVEIITGSGFGITLLATNNAVSLTGGIIGSTQALTGTGATPAAANLTTLTTAITTANTGAQPDAISLANGTAAQLKIIVIDVLTAGGHTAVLTPTTKTGFTTVTFAAAGDTVMLQYFTTRGWMVISSKGAVVA